MPVSQFTETHYRSEAQVTGAYKGAIFTCTGKTNAGAFEGFSHGKAVAAPMVASSSRAPVCLSPLAWTTRYPALRKAVLSEREHH